MTTGSPTHLARVRRMRQLHARIQSRINVANGCMAAAGDLTALQGDRAAPALQRALLEVGLNAIREAGELALVHPDLGGWKDTLESAYDDVTAFQAAIVQPVLPGETLVKMLPLAVQQARDRYALRLLEQADETFRPLQNAWAERYAYDQITAPWGVRPHGLRPF